MHHHLQTAITRREAAVAATKSTWRPCRGCRKRGSSTEACSHPLADAQGAASIGQAQRLTARRASSSAARWRPQLRQAQQPAAMSDKRTLRSRKVSERMAVVDEADRRRVRPPLAAVLRCRSHCCFVSQCTQAFVAARTTKGRAGWRPLAACPVRCAPACPPSRAASRPRSSSHAAGSNQSFLVIVRLSLLRRSSRRGWLLWSRTTTRRKTLGRGRTMRSMSCRPPQAQVRAASRWSCDSVACIRIGSALLCARVTRACCGQWRLPQAPAGLMSCP